MARSRNIKPGFFRNEVLVGLPYEFRLLFIGLWTIADREGRFEDRPVKIKMELFPADNVDVDAGLQALHDHGFITRYSVDAERYCQVLAWCKHQNPHVKEAPSTIPAPDKHDASPVQAPEIPERAGLIPSSLIPSSRALERQAARSTSKRADRFDEFWAIYPRKVSCVAAQKAFAKLQPSDELVTTILVALSKQAASLKWRTEPQFIPHASTWINGKRWEDAIEQHGTSHGDRTETPDYMQGAI